VFNVLAKNSFGATTVGTDMCHSVHFAL